MTCQQYNLSQGVDRIVDIVHQQMIVTNHKEFILVVIEVRYGDNSDLILRGHILLMEHVQRVPVVTSCTPVVRNDLSVGLNHTD